MRYTEFLNRFYQVKRHKIYTDSFDSDMLFIKTINNLLIEKKERIALCILESMDHLQKIYIMNRVLKC